MQWNGSNMGDNWVLLSYYSIEKQSPILFVELESTFKGYSMGASGGPRLSGMQKQVLSLYRGFLRAARSKSPEDRHQIESIVSSEFRHNSKVIDRKNFLYIEYLLRRGKKQLDQLKSPDIAGLSTLNLHLSQNREPQSLQ